MFDLMILGGGPAGYVAAERAAQKGLRVVLFEKKNLGGVCLNEGCIPTKTLLHSARVYDNARYADKYGIQTGSIGFDYAKMLARKNKIVRKLMLGIDATLKQHGVTLIKGEAIIEGRSGGGFMIRCNDTTYEGKNILICTGSEAVVPRIDGIKAAGYRVLTNREILDLKVCPESLVIVGGGVIGMEFASLFNSLGSQVTVIELMPEILGGLDAEISTMLRGIYEKKGVRFELGAAVTRIESNGGVVFVKDGAEQRVEAEKVLLSVGRRAVINGFGLETLGVELSGSSIKVDERMRTSVLGVYAAGDVTGFSMLAHTASRAAEVVVNNLCGLDDVMSYKAIPGVIYTNPEVATVGLTEAEAEADMIWYELYSLPMAYSGRFVAENEGVNGLCKVLVGEDEKVLGVHMLGNPASELIFGACMAIEQGLTLNELKRIVFPHPTVSEIFSEALKREGV